MKFGPIPSSDANGGILAHTVQAAGRRFAKGHVLSDEDVTLFEAEGLAEVVVARLDAGDLMEDEAASHIAAAMARDHLTFSNAATGRINIHAGTNGLFIASRAVVDRLNRVDPAITFACLADHAAVRAGDMVATIKIIPLAVAGALVETATGLLQAEPAVVVKPFAAHRVALISTRLPSLKPSVMDKTRRTFEQRLQLSSSTMEREERVDHTAAAVAAAIEDVCRQVDIIVIFGASAVADKDDVIPSAIRAAGGRVDHVGMPVDPGNLLVLGQIGETTVIGAPGCARSPRENGFDWVLNRILAGERPDVHDITGLGVGGLLMEIPTRPSLRALPIVDRAPAAVAIVLLAAGQASRMGPSGHHKLLAEFHGVPLVRRAALAALGSSAAEVFVVTGHRRTEVLSALNGLAIKEVENPDFSSGMASSLVAGVDAARVHVEGILIMLADMPDVAAADLDRLIAAFLAEKGLSIVRAVCAGKRGNPVILPHATFEAIGKLQGDVGARHIIETCGLPIVDIDIGPAAYVDLDTTEAVLAAGGILKG